MKDNILFRVQNLYKTYKDGTKALNDVSVDIPRNKVTVIIGPSGSGKSTLLRTLNLIEKPTKGVILYENQNILEKKYNKEKHRRKVAMVFQSFNLFPHLTILENINIAQMSVLGIDELTATKTSMDLLDKIGLKDKVKNYPNQLSGGQKQRIAIARSLAMSPKAILFDEPTSALDPEMIGEVLKVMKDLALSGITMIVVTHEMDFAQEFGNNIIVMDEGKIIEQGTPQQVFSRPRAKRTEKFLKRVIYKI